MFKTCSPALEPTQSSLQCVLGFFSWVKVDKVWSWSLSI